MEIETRMVSIYCLSTLALCVLKITQKKETILSGYYAELLSPGTDMAPYPFHVGDGTYRVPYPAHDERRRRRW